MIGSSSISNRLFMRFPVRYPEHQPRALRRVVQVETAAILGGDLATHPKAEAVRIVAALGRDDSLQLRASQPLAGVGHREADLVRVGMQLCGNVAIFTGRL